MLRWRVIITLTFVFFALSTLAVDQDVYKSMALRIMRFVSLVFKIWNLCLSSKEAWEGLEKPLGTFRTETFAECGEKSEQDGCGMMHFDRHDNRGYKWCTPAKVDHSQLHFLLDPAYIFRLAASTQIIRSAKRSAATATFLGVEMSLSTCLLRFHSVSHF